ncbi:hypothetical protein NHQ30_006975 [Ciborinia camelliae]|nr:hypothetical protein NHQ30_006975 [Ciborinia camelliae]
MTTRKGLQQHPPRTKRLPLLSTVKTRTDTMVVTNTPVEVELDPYIIDCFEEFWRQNPAFPKDLRYFGQVLTLTIIIEETFTNFDRDLLAGFIGTIYLPYLYRERKNNPLSPIALWEQSNNHRDNREPRDCSIFDNLHHCHRNSEFDIAFRAFLEENCSFVLELFREEPSVVLQTPAQIPVPNLELELVLADRALEAKSREAGTSDASR